MLSPVILSKSEEEKHLRIRGGGEIDFWSADGGTPGEGRRYSLAIFDECAMMSAELEKLWTRSLRPTLADFQGSAWFLSTSKGANAYFNQIFSYGQGEREDFGRPGRGRVLALWGASNGFEAPLTTALATNGDYTTK